MADIKDTKNSMVQFVFPEHANNIGTLHGGQLMDWIMLIGTITSTRFTKSTTLLGATDSIDFINPIKIGDIVMLDSWIEYVGNSSLEVVVRVYSEDLAGERKLITLSNLAFVAIDNTEKPKKVNEKIKATNDNEKILVQKAEDRQRTRLPEIKKRKEKVINAVDETETTRFNLRTISPVMPSDAFFYGCYMSVGKLLKYIDETAAILAMRYSKGVLVTGSLDNLFFYSPIKVGEVVVLNAGITYVGLSSIEIAIKIDSENMETGNIKHVCTAFLTFVHLDKEGKASAVPQFHPETPYEIREWKEAENRKNIRIERLKNVKSLADGYLEDYKNTAVAVDSIKNV